MAKETITLGINLRKNNNSHSRAYGKYYPEVDRTDTLSLRGFAQHLTNHGCLFGRDVIEAVLTKVVQCLPEVRRYENSLLSRRILVISSHALRLTPHEKTEKRPPRRLREPLGGMVYEEYVLVRFSVPSGSRPCAACS